MRIVSLSVTEASRNFADCVNRARYQGTTFVLHKNGVAVARIAPVERNTKNIEELEVDTAGVRSQEQQAVEPQRLRIPEIW